VTAAPKMHLPAHGIVEYALGTAGEAAGLAMACHLELCAHCQAEVAASDEASSLMLEGMAGVPVNASLLERVLARLDDPVPAPAPWPPLPRGLAGMPEPLRPYLAATGGRWRMLVPGARAIDLKLGEDEATARLVRFRPGFVIPLHDHAGAEYTVILSGSLEDGGAVAARGDVVYREPGDQHVQRITPGEECVALVVNEGPLVPLTMKGRLLRFITGV
jgi:putative transcriptional regulator